MIAFAVTFDYRCPFARNAHEHVLDGLAIGAGWNVRWLPFSLSAAKGADWVREADSGLFALELAVAVRESQPEHFLAVHRELFALRHDHSASLRDPATLREALGRTGVDVDAAFAEVDTGVPLKIVQDEHDAGVREHEVWGVPTFIAGDQAAFVRLMERPATSAESPVTVVERIVALLTDTPELNEFKHTSIAR